jgi:RNA polymerase sigma-70 factor, ECF subfamily
VHVVEVIEQTDEQLALEAAREGSDGPAFTTLVRRHQERVWRICYRLLSNEHDAADAAQEVFVGLFLNRAAFAGRSRFTTWLHAVSVQTCLKLRRSRSRRKQHEAEAAQAHQQQIYEGIPNHAGHTLDLAQMLETLDEEDRALLILKYAEEYSYEELAPMFGLSESACKMRIARARDRLQKQFPDLPL